MITRSPILKTASILTSRYASKFGGGVHNKAFLDPRKHIGMYKYETPFFYEEYWQTGFYPQTFVRGSKPSAAYQPKIEEVLVKSLNTKYNTNFKIEDIAQERIDRFFQKVLKSGDNSVQFFNNLNNKLAKQIIVKQSRWTWLKQQQYRAIMGSEIISYMEINTFAQYLQGYNFMIEQLITISNLGLSNIPQEPTAQEKQLHRQLNSSQVEGIPELRDTSRPENNNVVNRLLHFLHSV